MSKPKSNIDKYVKAFVKELNTKYAKLQKEENKGKDPKDKKNWFPLLTFQIGGAAKANFRTPEEQAVLLAQKTSKKPLKTKIAWSAHMTNRARHVPVRIDGKVSSRTQIKTALGSIEDAKFNTNWVAAMKKHKLYNAAGKQTWYGADWLHLELGKRDIDKDSALALECMEKYVELVDGDFDRLNLSLEISRKIQLKTIRDRLGIVKPVKPVKP